MWGCEGFVLSHGQLAAQHQYIFWCLNPNADLIAVHPEPGDSDVIADSDCFAALAKR